MELKINFGRGHLRTAWAGECNEVDVRGNVNRVLAGGCEAMKDERKFKIVLALDYDGLWGERQCELRFGRRM